MRLSALEPYVEARGIERVALPRVAVARQQIVERDPDGVARKLAVV